LTHLFSPPAHTLPYHARQYSNHSNNGDNDISDNDDGGDIPHEAYWELQYQERFGQSVKSPLQSLISATHKSTSDNWVSTSPHLTHTDTAGKATMVDVSSKTPTVRTARAKATVNLGETAYELVKSNKSQKGDVLAVARIAGIIGAKKTSDLIPLCHNIPISKVLIEFVMNDDDFSIDIFSEAVTVGVTGIEMEALTAVSISALTVYDMCKAVTHHITISDIKLLHKSGGKALYNSDG